MAFWESREGVPGLQMPLSRCLGAAEQKCQGLLSSLCLCRGCFCSRKQQWTRRDWEGRKRLLTQHFPNCFPCATLPVSSSLCDPLCPCSSPALSVLRVRASPQPAALPASPVCLAPAQRRAPVWELLFPLDNLSMECCVQIELFPRAQPAAGANPGQVSWPHTSLGLLSLPLNMRQ